MASRGSLSVLESANSISLNKIHDLDPPSKKRKLAHDVTTSICIRAHASSASDKPFVLEPIAVLPRTQFPLSYLDASIVSSQMQHSSLFAADILALENDLQEQTGPAVLVARLVSSGGLYAVERVKAGIYSLSRLGSWVNEGDIFVAVKGWRGTAVPAPKANCDLPKGGNVSWWQAAQIEDPGFDSRISAKRAKLDVSVVFGPAGSGRSSNDGINQHLDSVSANPTDKRRESTVPRLMPNERSFSTDINSSNVPQLQSDGDVFTDVGRGGEVNTADTTQSPLELLDGLRDHYLQALYVSKTSVAYFAKGPLARCRAAFHSSDPQAPAKTTDLIAFYREAILTAKKMDLKYRETLPSTIRSVALSVSDDESTSKTKKRKSRKKKLGRNGLYPEEESFIRTWWKDRSLTEHATTAETSREAEAKRHAADLRLRETQLQILLILETMALESATSHEEKEAKENGDDILDHKPKASKAKKPQDLNVLLELHLDRLCIWHAVSFEELTVTDPIKAYDSNHLAGKKVESDAIRDFCTEVIIPFYASRLPDKCKYITRKFGVSSGISPFGKQTRSKSSSRAEPGSTVQRQQPQKPRRTLQRVLTDEQTSSQKRHPSLSRSNTAPSKQEANRESMEPLLPMLSASVRGGIQKPKRVDNREVDLNAVARQHETKLKKVQMLVDQKKELNAAINALRKPNRELVAKDIAEDAHKRLSTGSSRKSKNPVRNPLGQGVQVMATPKGARKKDVMVGLPPIPRTLVRSATAKPSDSSPYRSEPSVVPCSSALRPDHFSGSIPRPRIARGPDTDFGAVQETPSRRPSRAGVSRTSLVEDVAEMGQFASHSSSSLFRVPNLPVPRSTGDIAPSTPVASKRIEPPLFQHDRPWSATNVSSMIMETPPRPNTVASSVQEFAPRSPPAVLGTPVKNAAKLDVPLASTLPVTPAKSIYEQLGWDEDDPLM